MSERATDYFAQSDVDFTRDVSHAALLDLSDRIFAYGQAVGERTREPGLAMAVLAAGAMASFAQLTALTMSAHRLTSEEAQVLTFEYLRYQLAIFSEIESPVTTAEIFRNNLVGRGHAKLADLLKVVEA